MIIGNILIIDDESINAEAMKDILEDVNYNVVLAADAQQAKTIVKNQSFDLIMMDVWMPGQDGMSLLEEWMSTNFSMPIVMMSGHAEHQDVVKAIKLGAVDFLKKPLHDILPLVRKLLSEKINDDKQKMRGINFDLPLKAARNIFEAKYFDHHLAQNRHNIAKVAELAGLERTTLYRKLKDLGVDKK
ncbi:Two-component transcriptional response regulator, LuxR family [uncultured Gammaproteobacteria bacterium]|uniref:response regulator n=1 Tax=Bathymodiolus heckerae thiotrophic gill symbiont TaxID=1052212 RepID=UPI0010BBAA97|nr:response regulator [Bathymodiolus heckerae thiotrophic gill symbiont]CAC9436945.1 Two-component transcriptional response regulator, LuxR family [uncultured Gammaproteobacteria bacterium]SMN13236.1 Response regulator containing CheY-like receiver, AAA-type ATPase, and DNA-binding domains [Bathymodiolus heckerae thiotrophic gill symbiont]SMN15904.1 Response regulator containing CheY-like receiver, AAA-type ATPase, and DNA-binding domains [uncultured Candidatus Thioglobus sp.]